MCYIFRHHAAFQRKAVTYMFYQAPGPTQLEPGLCGRLNEYPAKDGEVNMHTA